MKMNYNNLSYYMINQYVIPSYCIFCSFFKTKIQVDMYNNFIAVRLVFFLRICCNMLVTTPTSMIMYFYFAFFAIK